MQSVREVAAAPGACDGRAAGCVCSVAWADARCMLAACFESGAVRIFDALGRLSCEVPGVVPSVLGGPPSLATEGGAAGPALAWCNGGCTLFVASSARSPLDEPLAVCLNFLACSATPNETVVGVSASQLLVVDNPGLAAPVFSWRDVPLPREFLAAAAPLSVACPCGPYMAVAGGWRVGIVRDGVLRQNGEVRVAKLRAAARGARAREVCCASSSHAVARARVRRTTTTARAASRGALAAR